MINSIKQENFKLLKKKSTFIIPLIIIALMTLQALLLKNYVPPKILLESNFGGVFWVTLLLIIQSSTIITMEFHYGTIKNILYRNSSRKNIILSKILILAIYSLIYFAITIVFSLILCAIFYHDINIFSNVGNELSLFNQMLLGTLGCYIGTWLVLSITLLISCAMNRSEISIAVGIVFFLITSLLSSILAMAIDRWPWLKWGPINMMNITSQISDHSLKATTKLELHELVLGNIFYIIIFLILVVFVFKKKNV